MSNKHFIEFTNENQVATGTAVMLRSEADERLAFCPFATLLIERIEKGKTPDGNVYHLARPYMRREGSGPHFVVDMERVSIEGFAMLAKAVVVHNHGTKTPYVVS